MFRSFHHFIRIRSQLRPNSRRWELPIDVAACHGSIWLGDHSNSVLYGAPDCGHPAGAIQFVRANTLGRVLTPDLWLQPFSRSIAHTFAPINWLCAGGLIERDGVDGSVRDQIHRRGIDSRFGERLETATRGQEQPPSATASLVWSAPGRGRARPHPAARVLTWALSSRRDPLKRGVFTTSWMHRWVRSG